MSEWKEMTLGDVVENKSRRFDFKNFEEVVFINTGDVLEGKFLHKNTTSKIGLPGQAKKAIQKGDILFSEIRPANKRFAKVDFDPKNYVVSTKFMVLSKINDDVDIDYLYTILSSNQLLEEFQRIAESRSGTFPQITFDAISYFPVQLPPLPEQKAIAHILGSLDEKIELNRQLNHTLEAMAQALFKSWFVDFDPVIDNAIQAGNEIPEELQARAEKRRRLLAGHVIASAAKQSPTEVGMKQSPDVIASDEGARQSQSLKPLLHTNPSLAAQFPASFVLNETLGKWIPEGWEVKTIKEFGKVVCGKTPSKSNPEFYGGSIPFVKIPNMHNEVFVLSTEEYLTEKGSESQANKLIPPGSISVSCIATVGKVIITNQPCHTNQQINSVVPNKLIYRYFLYFTMLNLERHFHDLASAGSTTLNMNTSTFSNISILFPSKEVLSEFHKLVFPKFSKILLNQIEKETLTNLRDRLLPELISGRVRVPVYNNSFNYNF